MLDPHDAPDCSGIYRADGCPVRYMKVEQPEAGDYGRRKAMNTKILFEVAHERGRQDQKWGGSCHDDRHTTGAFAEFIESRAYKVRAFLGSNPHCDANTQFGFSSDTSRSLLIEIAALAVAAVESIDRKNTSAQSPKGADS